MAKVTRFADKAKKKAQVHNCPVCDSPKSFVKYIKAERSDRGWKFVTTNVGVCKCNHSEIYG
jgi:formate dehydrogenase maturation protein FdhE